MSHVDPESVGSRSDRDGRSPSCWEGEAVFVLVTEAPQYSSVTPAKFPLNSQVTESKFLHFCGESSYSVNLVRT